MLITLDVGNTHTEAAIFKGREICERFEMKTTDVQSGAIGAAPLVDWLAAKRAAGLEVKSAVVASVVPAVTPLLGLTLSRTCNLETLVVSSDVKLNVTLGMDSKCTLGMDRMVNAMAAREYYKLPALVIDLGTASTFDFINSEGCFEGGAIAPGMQMGLDALAARTAKLPALKIKWPESVVGTNTEKAMLSGSVPGRLTVRREVEAAGAF